VNVVIIKIDSGGARLTITPGTYVYLVTPLYMPDLFTKLLPHLQCKWGRGLAKTPLSIGACWVILSPPAPTPYRARGHAPSPTFTNGWARRAPCVEMQQTKLYMTTPKALTNTTNCTCIEPWTCAPHFQIRFCATDCLMISRDVFAFSSAGTNLKARGTGLAQKCGEGEGRQSGANRRKNFLGRAPPLFGSKCTMSRFGERFCGGQYSLVSFVFVFLLLTVPPCPAICKSGGTCPPCPMESAPLFVFYSYY